MLKSLYTARRRSTEAGFGLVELIVVVAIIGILVIVAIPVYGAIQDNAQRQATQEAANNAYTTIVSAYETGGKAEAVKVLGKLNTQSPSMAYMATNPTRNSLKSEAEVGADLPRTQIERGIKTNPNIIPVTAYKTAATTTGNLGSLGHPNDVGDGTAMCAIAISGSPNARFAAFAGPGCGDAYKG